MADELRETPRLEGEPTGYVPGSQPETHSEGYYLRKAQDGKAPDNLPKTDGERYWYEEGVRRRKSNGIEDQDGLGKQLDLEQCRTDAIFEAELPKDLAKLVPRGLEDPAGWIEENLKGIKDRLAAHGFGNPTRPGSVQEPDRVQQIGERFEVLKRQYGQDHKEVQSFYNKFTGEIRAFLGRKRGGG